MLYEKHQTPILPQKSHFIKNKFKSDFHYVSYKYVCHLKLQTGQRCDTVFHSNQTKTNRHQPTSSCQPIHLYL